MAYDDRFSREPCFFRGGRSEAEIAHGEQLLGRDIETTWGWATPAGQRRVAARISWFVQVLGLRPGMRVLECGCGTGVFTRHLASLDLDLTAADLVPALMREAARHCDGRRVRFVQTNLEDPRELPDDTYDAICGVSVLHHLDTRRSLAALFRKLRPGGRFAFSEPNLLNPINRFILFTPDQERRRRHGISPAEMAFTPDELRDVLQEAGFAVDSLRHRDFLHPSTPTVLIPLVRGAQSVAEATPGLRMISGSLWVSGHRPDAS